MNSAAEEEDGDEATREAVFVATTRREEEEPEIERGVEEKGRPRTGFGRRPRRGRCTSDATTTSYCFYRVLFFLSSLLLLLSSLNVLSDATTSSYCFYRVLLFLSSLKTSFNAYVNVPYRFSGGKKIS